MAATVSSPWAKPGAWALDSEEHEAAELEQQQHHQAKIEAQPLADFPSLSAAAAAKPKKKNKGQKVSLAEFSAFGGPKPAQVEPVGLTHEDRLVLPTGPRERTAEELDRDRLGGGFKSYGGDRNREDSSSKWGRERREGGGGGFGKESDRDAPSRADEDDDWGAGKKSVTGNGFEKRERVGFGFGSQSKADESDSWVRNKSSVVGGGGGGFDRERKVGFGSNGGADSETWGRRREESNGGFERERKVGLGFNSNGGGADSESWGRRREESNGGTESTGRPRLNLQPRTLPVTLPPVVSSNETSPVAVAPVALDIVPKPRGANPFGAARPREEVLAEKGQDWKKIDEELEAVKLKEKEAVVAEGESFGKRSFGMGNGRSGDRTEGVWRKPVVAGEQAEAEAEAEDRPQSAGNDESRSSNSEELETETENETVTEN